MTPHHGLTMVVSAIFLSFAAPPGVLAADSYTSEHPETWDAPPSKDQMDHDATLIPVAKGAIFVPSMTDPRLEPNYVVMKDGEVLTSIKPGTRAVLAPGIYEVLIGSGSLDERLSRKVMVKEGLTTRIPATWGGVVVNVVDTFNQPFRGTYELVRFPEKRSMGVGLGADVEMGDEVRTWILAPGKYMLVRAGATGQARRDFFTFRLPAGELMTLNLVLDEEDGSFLGCGEPASVAGPERKKSDWRLNLVVGGDAEFNRRSDMVGYPSGYGFTFGGYFDFSARYRPEKHYFYIRLRLEEKQVKLPDEPFMKDLDELKFDTLYVYRVVPWFGPYVRLGAQTALFPSFTDFDSATTVVEVNADGNPISELGSHEGRFELSKSFAPTELKAGAGLGFLVTNLYWFDANVRIGFGGRYLFNRGLLTPKGTLEDGRYSVLRREDAYQYGIEATAIASLRVTRWGIATTELEVLEPMNDFSHPIVDWESNVGLRLGSFVSINYIYKLLLDRDRSDSLQTEHRVVLRFSWKIL